jgi:hypothetical protein
VNEKATSRHALRSIGAQGAVWLSEVDLLHLKIALERAEARSQRQERRLLRRLRRKSPLCGARTRRGTACICKAVIGRERCRFHGGLSTGPRTEAGRRRVAEASRARMLRRWQQWSTERQGGSIGGAA